MAPARVVNGLIWDHFTLCIFGASQKHKTHSGKSNGAEELGMKNNGPRSRIWGNLDKDEEKGQCLHLPNGFMSLWQDPNPQCQQCQQGIQT